MNGLSYLTDFTLALPLKKKKKQKLITIKRITRICCIMHFTHSINDCLGDLFVPFLATGACVCNSYTCLIVTAAGIQ